MLAVLTSFRLSSRSRSAATTISCGRGLSSNIHLVFAVSISLSIYTLIIQLSILVEQTSSCNIRGPVFLKAYIPHPSCSCWKVRLIYVYHLAQESIKFRTHIPEMPNLLHLLRPRNGDRISSDHHIAKNPPLQKLKDQQLYDTFFK